VQQSVPAEAEAAATRVHRRNSGIHGVGGGRLNPVLPEYLQESKSGYRVLAIQENSPACREGIVPFFDFIVAANGEPVTTEDGTFVRVIREFENKHLTITLYNCKCKSMRQLAFVPRRGWGGDGLLGLTIKFDSFEDADDNVIHILDVKDNSPAQKAGFEPYNDYLLGTPYSVFKDLDDLSDLVMEVSYENDGGASRGIDIFVYSTRTDTVRRLVIKPSSTWGGEGLLGCGIGHGLLHKLPTSAQESPGYARPEDLIPLSRTKAGSTTTSEGGEPEPIVTKVTTATDTPTQAAIPSSQPPPKSPVTPPSAQKVQTPNGLGTLYGSRANGMHVIELDWGLPNGATALTFLQNGSFETLSQSPQHPDPTTTPENNCEVSPKVIDVDLPRHESIELKEPLKPLAAQKKG